MSEDRIDELLASIAVPGKRPRRDVAALDVPKKGVGVDDEWDTKPIIKHIKGKPIEFFTIGNLAAALGRRPVTVRSWEMKGWLPKSPYRTKMPKGAQVPGKETQGRRLYTRAQVQTVIDAARANKVLANNARDADWLKFRKTVLNGWKAMQ